MQLDVSVNSASVLLGLRNGQKRLVYTTGAALRKTALRVQAEQRAHVAKALTLRGKRDFILRQGAIVRGPDVASRKLEVSISVGEKPGLLLTTLERGGTRVSKAGSAVAVPVTGGARPSERADIPAPLFVRRLALRRARGRGKRKVEGGAGGLKGLLGSFTVRGKGVFQRVGGTVRALYIYKPSVRVPHRLDFIKNAHRVAARWFKQELAIAVREALNFNRNR